MIDKILKRKLRLKAKRKKRIRGQISGTAECPRISIFKSNRTVYAQAIDDMASVTLASINGVKLGVKANKEGAAKLGQTFAKDLKDKGLNEAVFDRNGYLYHGVVASFADALRENGIKI